MNVTEETNGQPHTAKPPSLLANLAGVLEDHVHLATVEAQYEVDQARRRFLVMGIALILGAIAFLLGQVAIVDGLVNLFKLPVWAVCLILMVLYGGTAAYIFQNFGLRDPKAGAPFSGTRRELIETLQWIQKLFS
jgi:uncharacterized membrane protein YqjE